VELKIETVKRCGFRALHLQVLHPEQHAHRHLHHIEKIIDAAGKISPSQKQLAKAIFLAIAEAEAKVITRRSRRSISMKWVPSIQL